jgi:hypothetical protein
MPIYTPYFYIIQEIDSGKYYAGCRYSKYSDPNTLMQEGGYITSSKAIQTIVAKKGVSAFKVRKIRKFETAAAVYEYETRFLQKVDAKKNERFFNMHNNDAFLAYDPEWRKIPDKNGTTSYQKGGKKAAKTKTSTIIDGKNICQIAYYKAIKKNKNLHKIRAEKAREAMMKIDPVTGLNRYQEMGVSRMGDNNPSKKPENAARISQGRKKYISENREEWLNRQALVNSKLSSEKDEFGLTVRDKHSIWMKENNPATGTRWFNNGEKNLRLKQQESIPEGYSPGRIKKKF